MIGSRLYVGLAHVRRRTEVGDGLVLIASNVNDAHRRGRLVPGLEPSRRRRSRSSRVRVVN
jgi:hypothetical protein